MFYALAVEYDDTILANCSILKNMRAPMLKVREKTCMVHQYNPHDMSYDEAVAKMQQIHTDAKTN